VQANFDCAPPHCELFFVDPECWYVWQGIQDVTCDRIKADLTYLFTDYRILWPGGDVVWFDNDSPWATAVIYIDGFAEDVSETLRHEWGHIHENHCQPTNQTCYNAAGYSQFGSFGGVIGYSQAVAEPEAEQWMTSCPSS
jgi:hypothetical protein